MNKCVDVLLGLQYGDEGKVNKMLLEKAEKEKKTISIIIEEIMLEHFKNKNINNE